MSKTPKRGEASVTWIARIIESADGELSINLPSSLIEQLEWKAGDRIEHDITENCFDWGEVTSIVLRNLTKEKNT